MTNLLQGSGVFLENGVIAFDVDTATWIVGDSRSVFGYQIIDTPLIDPGYMHYFRSGLRRAAAEPEGSRGNLDGLLEDARLQSNPPNPIGEGHGTRIILAQLVEVIEALTGRSKPQI